MSKLGRFVPVAVAATLAAAAACGGDSTGNGPVAASVTGIAGDSQSGPTGATLPFPLSFVALGSNGQPAQGVHVTWSVIPSGSASFNPATSTTDASGAASTSATLGSFVGGINIHAALPGVSDVVYHVTAVDPCQFIKAYTVGQTVTGTLSSGDCVPGIPFYYDLYDLTLSAPQSLRITMRWSGPPSTDTLDAWVELYRFNDDRRVGFDDDSVPGEQQNSQLDIILPADHYFIGATSFGPFDTGPYTLSSELRPAAMSGCRQVWMLSGTSVADSVTANDCADSAASPHHYDVARIHAVSGTVLSIAERSTAINPSLALYRVYPENRYSRRLLVSNDDSSATNTNAFIAFSVDTTSEYDVIIGTSAVGETGAYTFEVLPSTTLSGRAAAPITRGREPWGVLGLPRRAKH